MTRIREWARGSAHVFTWEPRVGPGYRVRLEVRAGDAAAAAYALAEDVPGEDGRLVWHVPDAGAENLRFRLVRNWMPAEELDLSVHVVPSRARNYKVTKVSGGLTVPPRDGAGAIVFADRMWLIGGWNPERPTDFPRETVNEVWSSTDGATWRLEKPNTFFDDNFDPTLDWEGRHTGNYFVRDGRMWIVGGDALTGVYQNDIWSSDNGKVWARVADSGGFPKRILSTTAQFGTSLLTFGGQTTDGVFYDDVWSSTDGQRWSKIEQGTPHWSGRGGILGSMVFKDRLWVLGGGRYETDTTPWTADSQVWSTPDGAHWVQEGDPQAPWKARIYHDVTVYDGRMWVLGGYNGDVGNLADAWYSDDGENWYDLDVPEWPARHAASAWVYHGALFYGFGNSEPFIADMWRIDAVTP
ncbi:MAG: hypothetical protein HOO96_02305 [Polyangiaceae bacterium]|nr:hypothetical protein [Polyangiaceae bacterium]